MGQTVHGLVFAFKLHLIFNDQGEWLNLMLTPGNVDDRQPVPQMERKFSGRLFGDKGYLSKKLFEELLRAFRAQLHHGYSFQYEKPVDAFNG